MQNIALKIPVYEAAARRVYKKPGRGQNTWNKTGFKLEPEPYEKAQASECNMQEVDSTKQQFKLR